MHRKIFSMEIIFPGLCISLFKLQSHLMNRASILFSFVVISKFCESVIVHSVKVGLMVLLCSLSMFAFKESFSFFICSHCYFYLIW